MIDKPSLERYVAAGGDLARPSAIFIAACAAALATVILAIGACFGAVDLIAASAFIGAAWAGVAALYGAKALEEGRKSKADASVKIAQANTETST